MLITWFVFDLKISVLKRNRQDKTNILCVYFLILNDTLVFEDKMTGKWNRFILYF
jgi:hypothetical protein